MSMQTAKYHSLIILNMQVLLSDEAKRLARRRGHAPVSPGPDESPGGGGGDAAQSPWRVREQPLAGMYDLLFCHSGGGDATRKQHHSTGVPCVHSLFAGVAGWREQRA